MEIFLKFIQFLLEVLAFAIFLRAILSWFITDPGNPIIVVLDYITKPILSPLRRIIPRIGMVDITPMIAILILVVIAQLIP